MRGPGHGVGPGRAALVLVLSLVVGAALPSWALKERTEAAMRFAHRLARAADRLEAFTLGTRLTRITQALRARHPDQALARISQTVDFP